VDLSPKTKLFVFAGVLMLFGVIAASFSIPRLLTWKRGTVTVRTCRAYTEVVRHSGHEDRERRHDMTGALEIPTGNKYPYNATHLPGECEAVGSVLEASYDPADPNRATLGDSSGGLVAGVMLVLAGVALILVGLIRNPYEELEAKLDEAAARQRRR
jgi:hypothetical protein